MKKIIAILTIIAIAILTIILLMPQNTPAPTFETQDIRGQTINNNILNDKVTLINFWFPSCPGCVSEMPKLIKTAKDYHGKNFQIIGIAVPIDPLSSVENYVATRKLPFQVVFDEKRDIVKKFIRTEVYPTSVLINKRGEILKTFVGEPDFTTLYNQIDEELTK